MEIILDSCKVFAPSGVYSSGRVIYILSLLLLSLQSIAKPYWSGCLQKLIPRGLCWSVIGRNKSLLPFKCADCERFVQQVNAAYRSAMTATD